MTNSTPTSPTTNVVAAIALPDRRDIVIEQMIEFLEGTDGDWWFAEMSDMARILTDNGYDVYTIDDELSDRKQGLPRRKKTCRHDDDQDGQTA